MTRGVAVDKGSDLNVYMAKPIITLYDIIIIIIPNPTPM